MHAIVVIHPIPRTIWECVHSSERTDSTGDLETAFDLVVRVVVSEVRVGPVCREAGDVGAQGVPVLSAVDVEIGRVAGQTTEGVRECAGSLPRLSDTKGYE